MPPLISTAPLPLLVKLVNAVPAPTAPVNVVVPDPALMASVLPPFTVPLKETGPLLLARLEAPPTVVLLLKAIAPPLVVTLLDSVMPPAAVTAKLETGVLLPTAAVIAAVALVTSAKLFATFNACETLMPPVLAPVPIVTRPSVEIVLKLALESPSTVGALATVPPTRMEAAFVNGCKFTAPEPAVVVPVKVMLSAVYVTPPLLATFAPLLIVKALPAPVAVKAAVLVPALTLLATVTPAPVLVTLIAPLLVV